MNFRKGRARSRRMSTGVMINSEKWRSYAKRISVRDHEVYEDESEEDERPYKDINDWAQEFFNNNSSSLDKIDQDVEVRLTRKQTIILSTLLPDEILLMDKFNELEPKRFVGVLLMADVSGFTALSEKYNNTGKGGTYRLTVTLNTYIGSLVELIYSHGGDILKFAGDAFLALWKTDKRTFLCHTIHTVIACALVIQHSYSSYETDVKVSLKVKLAISAGNLIFAPIGTGLDMNYVIIGLPVLEAKLAESVCTSGEVKLTPTAWAHCYSRNYDHIVHEDGHVTVKSILYDPHEKDVTKPFIGFGALTKQMKRNFTAIESLPDYLWNPSKDLSPAEIFKKTDALNLRKTILIAEEKDIGSEIRKFMVRPVLTQIDAHQPLEYLTEMRQVSILFITLKPRECPFPQLVTIVNNAYQITCEIVYQSMGCVNKIILFDKDIMILVIFGLRGFKHESEAQAALKCGYNVRRSLAALDVVQEVSVGVTTGQVYCGVVGHPLRREFTVIGAIVNKAARLMCKFHNKVTCDETTFVKSKMSSNGFTLQPETKLKGIGMVGKIYEYTEEMRIKELYDIPMTQPLLDRIDEMEYYMTWLDDNQGLTYRDFDAVILVGEPRIGKSRLLEGMARDARNKSLHVCYICLSSIHSASPYLALSQIFNGILDLKEPITGFTKEEKIVQLLTEYNEDLCYLNNIIKVRFAYHEGMHSLDESKRKDKAKTIFSKLISAFKNTHVIILDDLQNLDISSWEFISLMFCSMKIFFVLSVTRGKFKSVNNWLYSVFINNSVRKIVLGALESCWIPALACQFLDVSAVPQALCDVIITKCNGLPGLVESFLAHLFSTGTLEIKKIQVEDIPDFEDEDLVFPDESLLHPQALDVRDQEALDELIQNDEKRDIAICVITDRMGLNINFNVQNLDALVMIQIDSLTPYQQLLLKIASVIGNILSRTLLEDIMYENNWLTTAKAIKRLFAMRILTCANVNSTKLNSQSSNIATSTSRPPIESKLICDCSFEFDPDESPENLPKYAFCKVMKFKNSNTRKTCYELLPINQKKEFHTRIVNYLEGKKQKCVSCGGSLMVVQSVMNLQPRESIYSNLSFEFPNAENSSSSDSIEINYSKQESQSEPQQRGLMTRSVSETLKEGKHDVNIAKTVSEAIIHDITRASSYLMKMRMHHASILKNKISQDTACSRRSAKRVTMTKFSFAKPSPNNMQTNNIFDMIREVIEADYASDWHMLGVVDSQEDVTDAQQKNKTGKTIRVKIERGVSQTDFMKCACADIQIAIYGQLIHHAKEAELKNKAIEYMITYAYLNLLANNADGAFPKLDEAESSIAENVEILNTNEQRRYLGKTFSIRAAACLMCGRVTAAKMELERALKMYQINLDKVSGILPIHSLVKYLKMKRKKYRMNALLIKGDSVFCLNVATLLYSTLGEERLSKLTAFKALEILQNVDCPFVDMCDAYSNALQVELDRGSPDSTAEIERLISNSLQQLSRPVRADELYAVGKLFMGTFKARLARGLIPPATHSGFRALTISKFLRANNIALDLIPDMFYILLARRRIEEAIDVLKLALRLKHEQVSHSCETWYYALCMDMILDAGFQLEGPHDISRFAEFSLSSDKPAGPSRRRLIVNLWTYWLRADSEKKAKRFESEALSWVASDEDDGSLTNLLSAMRLAEGMLESLARKVDDLRKMVDLMELRSIADRELSRLERDARLMRTLYPRWLLLKANSLKLSGRQPAGANLLNQAMEESRRVYNHLEEALAYAATSNSLFWIQSARASCFLHWQSGAEHARTSWHQLMYRITATKQA